VAKILKIQSAKLPKPRSKQKWEEVGGRSIFFRSKWEFMYAQYLQFLKDNKQIREWEHEPQTFWFENIKRGVRSYMPDFKVIENDGSHYWVEVKGYMDAKSNTKLKRFAKYYPQEKMLLVGKEWFKEAKDKFPWKNA
jgi:Protein of unknown function (DUF1064)